jgi:hypothetical protein
VLAELIDRYGEDAIVTADPHMLDSGDTYRWDLQIDGNAVPGANAHIYGDPDHRDWMVMVVVYGDEKVELSRWSTKTGPLARYGPARVVRRLGESTVMPVASSANITETTPGPHHHRI